MLITGLPERLTPAITSPNCPPTSRVIPVPNRPSTTASHSAIACLIFSVFGCTKTAAPHFVTIS